MKIFVKTVICLILPAILFSSCFISPSEVVSVSRSYQITNGSITELSIDFKKGIFDFESQFGDQLDAEFKLPGKVSAPQVDIINSSKHNQIEFNQANHPLINSSEQWSLKMGKYSTITLKI